MIGIATGKDLRLGLKPPESARVNYAVAIALEIIAVRMRWLRIAAPARLLDGHRIISQQVASLNQNRGGPLTLNQYRPYV